MKCNKRANALRMIYRIQNVNLRIGQATSQSRPNLNTEKLKLKWCKVKLKLSMLLTSLLPCRCPATFQGSDSFQLISLRIPVTHYTGPYASTTSSGHRQSTKFLVS
jgi:hypothetical protein